MADLTNLYPLSRAIIAALPNRFVRVEGHDPNEPEPVDRLWLEWTPDAGSTVGTRIAVEEDHGWWSVDQTDVYPFGGDCMSWSAIGSEAEMLAKVVEHIQSL